MMENLTVFIIDCGDDKKKDVQRLCKSFQAHEPKFIELAGKVDFSQVVCDTEWKMFLYSDEYLSGKLMEALPIFLTSYYSEQFDVYGLVKVEEARKNDPTRVWECPRIFRKTVEMRRNSIEPLSIQGLEYTRILDGFLIGM